MEHTEDLSPPPQLSPIAKAVRETVLDGLATVEEFAAGIDKCPRTVFDYITQGMPTVYVGRTPYIPIKEGAAWVLKPRARCQPARRPGRPASAKRSA